MAEGATIVHMELVVSDVDRGVYETFELTLARHPSETARYLVTRTLAYCLSYEEGIAFSKGGLSNVDEPPISIRDATGVLLAWIDIGAPSADRLHKASKAARRVALFSAVDRAQVLRQASGRTIHRVDEIEVNLFEPAFVAEIESRISRRMAMEVVRNEDRLYVTVAGATIEGALDRSRLV